MSSSLTTTYLGHRISVEPFEWGYLAQVVEPASGKCLIAASSSASRALEGAFEVIDDRLQGGGDGCSPTDRPPI